MIKTILVDDEEPARNRLRSLLKSDPEIFIALECGDGASARQALLELKPDLAFLDIEMPEIDGLSAISGLTERPYTIFVTAHQQHALDAFALHADDYLLKPFKNARLLEAVSYAKEQIHARAVSTAQQVNLEDQRVSCAAKGILPIKVDGKIVLLKLEEIEWITAERDYVQIVAENTTYFVRETMQSIHSRLDPSCFLRIHRSTIINIQFVHEVRPFATGECFVLLRNGQEFTMSRSHRAVLGSLLGLS